MDLKHRLLFGILSIASIFYLLIKFSLGYWKRRGILHEKPKFLWGNIKGVGAGGKRHISEVLQSCYQQYKGRAPFIGFYAYIKPYVLALDLDLVHQILREEVAKEYFMARGLYHNINDEPLSCNLMQLDGENWQRLHDKVNPAFACDKIYALLPRLMQVADVFKLSFDAKQKTQGIFIINDLVDCYNVDAIAALAFGISAGDTLRYPQTEFRTMTRNYLKDFNLLKSYLALEFPTLARLLQYKSYNQMASDYFFKVINEHLMVREWNRRDKANYLDDFLQLFVDDKCRHSAKMRLSDNEIAAQAFTFILNGLVPLNATLTFCLYELALQPDLQERARAEIEQVLQAHNGNLTVDSINDLVFIKQILKETLRLHTPYPFLLRKTIKSYELPHTVFMLAEGNNVIIPIAAIHRDPAIYPEPTRFDPERFETSAMRTRHECAWLPFGAGPRGCIAWQFAELQLLVGLVTMLQDYQFSPCSETPIPLIYDNGKLLLTPKSDIKLCVERVLAS